MVHWCAAYLPHQLLSFAFVETRDHGREETSEGVKKKHFAGTSKPHDVEIQYRF